jgi:hypothetical protein
MKWKQWSIFLNYICSFGALCVSLYILSMHQPTTNDAQLKTLETKVNNLIVTQNNHDKSITSLQASIKSDEGLIKTLNSQVDHLDSSLNTTIQNQNTTQTTTQTPSVKPATTQTTQTPKTSTQTVTINSGGTEANIRSGAGLSYPIVTTVTDNETLTYLGVEEKGATYDWIKVETSDGQTGWIDKYLTK